MLDNTRFEWQDPKQPHLDLIDPVARHFLNGSPEARERVLQCNLRASPLALHKSRARMTGNSYRHGVYSGISGNLTNSPDRPRILARR